MKRIAALIVLLSTVPACGATSPTLARLYGQIEFLASTGTRYILRGVDVYASTLQGAKTITHALTDSRGFYALIDITPGVYRLRIMVNGDQQVGGTIVRASLGATTVPSYLVDLRDPCLKYYGEGYAVDYIRTRVNVPWRAGGIEWLDYARRARWPVGTEPQVGAIAVFRFGPWGHVGWVESVSPGPHMFVVSQWNEPGATTGERCQVTARFGKETRTTWHFGDVHIRGFITPKEQ